MPQAPQAIAAELVAVLAAVTAGQARVLTTEDGLALPSGPFQQAHRSLQAGMRAWIERQTQHPIGYIEQLYTFADRDRDDRGAPGPAQRVISVSYLGLTREALPLAGGTQVGSWRDWYDYFPWEDRREQAAEVLLAQRIQPALEAWRDAAPDAATAAQRRRRVETAFGLNAAPWNEDFVLQRYELLYEARLLPEAQRRGRAATQADPATGRPMRQDFRRILATGIARLRAKIKYRPVVFELMPETFTLLQLQQAVEALAGQALHKQNFRRLMEQQALVEETGALAQGGSGRPAMLYRFRDDVLRERAMSGSKLPISR